MTGNTDPSINAYPGRHVGKVALVTGGRSGMGLAIAMRLQQEGASVITAQRGEASDFESISADFTDPESPAHVIEAVIKRS